MGQKYSPLKIFHYPHKLASLSHDTSEITAPLHIRIKPTNMCSHDCWYCAYRVSNLQLGQDMNVRDRIPAEKMREIIQDIIDMGVKAVTFSGGGEPFLYKPLLETVKTLAHSPVKFATLTNGQLLKGEIAEVFAFHGAWVRISIDGWDDKSYAEYRGIKEGIFTQVLDNIEQFKKLGGDCFLGISLIVDEKNANHLAELMSALKSRGVDSVKVAPCIVSNDGNAVNRYHAPFFQTVRAQIDEMKVTLADAQFEIFDAYHEMADKFDKDYEWCPYLQILPIIGADLKIYSCQDKAYTTAGMLGSIREVGFKDFWFDRKEKFFQVNPLKHCQHHCVANVKNQAILSYLDLEHKEFV